MAAPAEFVRPVIVGIASSAEDDSDEESRDRIMSIVADGEHHVWGIFGSQGARLALLKEGRWSLVTPKNFPETLRALQIARLSDGSVACLWRDEAREDVHALSRHTTTSHQVIVSGPARLPQPLLLPLAEGGMLVTAASRELFCIPKAGAQPEHITLDEKLFIPPKKNDDGSPRTDVLQVQAVQDARGSVWLWCPAMRSVDWMWRLRGMGRLANKQLRLQQFPGASPEQPISVLAPWKDGHLAIAVAGTGWFDFDDEKHHVTSFQGTGDEMKYVERIFSAGSGWHFITTPRPTETTVEGSMAFNGQMVFSEQRFYDPLKRTSALFSLHDSTLELRTWKLDAEPEFGWTDRPVIQARDGFWTCAGTCLAFVPYDPKLPLRRVDWRHGLDVSEPRELAQSGDSELAVLDRRTGKVHLLSLNQLPVEPAALRVDRLETLSLLLEDSQGRIWGRLADGAFQCWEDGRWQTLKVPEALSTMNDHAFVADSHDQGWLVPMHQGAAAVCDFATREWSVFESLQAALTAKMHPGDALKLRDFPSLAPISSTETPCQIAFMRKAGSLHHFDGHRWRDWTLADVAGPDARFTSSLSFAGPQLSVAISGRRWKLVPEGRWQSTEDEPEVEDNIYRYQEISPPSDCPVLKITSTAYDRYGVCWLTDKAGGFWKSIPGCTVPMLQPGESIPALAGMHLYDVRSDLNGNAFLRLRFGWQGGLHLAVRSRLPLPETVAALTKVQADTAHLTFGAGAWHTWRIDGGAWSLATDQKERAIIGLLPGPHEFEVLAYNADLTPAKASVKLKVTIEAAAIAETNALIQKLGGDDLDASESAARRLRSQGSSILPALRIARETASDSTRWWLDAVIQHIESPPSAQRAASAGAAPLLSPVNEP
ncbi:hypothetical protein [Prosthecobacter sp.]|uniref:hypothetical protein n=1 Tax=Prosthecobacter sp. TaxID=1965333 RepID=UPI0037832CE2